MAWLLAGTLCSGFGLAQALPWLVIGYELALAEATATLPQIIEAEWDWWNLSESRWIIGSLPTLEDLVNLVEEHEIGDSLYRFEGGHAEILAVVQHEMAVARGDVIELEDSEDDAEDEVEDVPTWGEVIKLFKVLEKAHISYGDADFSLELPHQLYTYRAKLQQDALLSSTQTSLNSYFILFKDNWCGVLLEYL